LSRTPKHLQNDASVKELIDDPHLHNWLDMARERIMRSKARPHGFAGLAGLVTSWGWYSMKWCVPGELSAPVVIGLTILKWVCCITQPRNRA
jgi:urocanate hydratase